MENIRINSGEYISIQAFEIKSIPHISIIGDTSPGLGNIDYVVEYAKEMVGMLTEVYQLYKEQYIQTSITPDIALDITWVSIPIENQPFKAEIKIYILLRSIGRSLSNSEAMVKNLTGLLMNALSSEKYEISKCEISKYQNLIPIQKTHRIRSIVKEERVENLQNSYLPHCFTIDKLPTDYQDLSKITSILTAHPYCAISFQIIPTFYNDEEINGLSTITQQVNMLSRGINDSQIGNLSITAAERVGDLFRYYSDNKNKPLYAYNIVIYGEDNSISNVATRVVGQLNATIGPTINLKFVDINPIEVFSSENSIYAMPWILNDIILNRNRNTNIWSTGLISNSFYRFPYIITADEAASFFRLPIGTDKINAGLNVNESTVSNKTYSKGIINAGDIELGKLKSSSLGDSIGLSLKDLAKHMLIVGTPGSGKTTFSVGLLDRLWKEHNIPFLVIEPAKNEYRALVQSIPELQVFTPGKNFISPFVFNPFVPPKNVKLETYKSTLKTAFAAGVSMSTPLDKIFEETINNCYSDFKWLDSYTIDNKGKIFNIADFIKCFQETFDAIGYTGDAKNIGRAGVVRLKSLVNLFDNYFSIPIEDILNKPTIIELAAIENSDQKALIIALILLSILAYVNANYVGEGGLKNFILLEEAHVLLDASSNGGEGAANPAAIAQGLIKRMLAEIRSYGVGLAIADQSPRKVGIDIVALTDIKVAFRLVESQDKQILADSTNMADTQITRLAKLKPGEAFLFFNKLEEPEEIITPDYRLANNISISLSDEGIKQLSTYWNDKQINLRPYPECALTPYCLKTCSYERRLLAKEIARRIFNKNIPVGTSNIDPLKSVLLKIQTLTLSELNDEIFDRKLLSCVKVHLWRKIKYDTKINISENTIKTSLAKE